MNDTYYVHEFEQHDGTLPSKSSNKTPFSEPENIIVASSLYKANSQAMEIAEERYGMANVHTTICENGDILFFKTGEPGGYRVRSTDDWESYQPLKPDEQEKVPPFGERNDVGEQYAKARIIVECEIYGFSDLIEVFSFRFNEPEKTDINRDSTPKVQFSLVKGVQKGTMDFGKEVHSVKMIPLHTVPESVRERASSMLDWADITVEDDSE